MHSESGSGKLSEIGPVIAAVRDYKQFDQALSAPVSTIFILSAELIALRDMCRVCQREGKMAFLHVDLIHGLANDEAALHFLSREVKPEGIISTHRGVVQAARKFGFYTVQRFFLLDSLSVGNIAESVKTVKPDFIEIMPGILAEFVRDLAKEVKVTVITGGLVRRREEVIRALEAGAVAVSTSRAQLWGYRDAHAGLSRPEKVVVG